MIRGRRRRVGPGHSRAIETADGMTLLEVVLAVSALAVLVLLAGATLRLGLRAWEAGQREADAQQEVRAVVELVTEALRAAFPYQGTVSGGLERVVLFEGEPEGVRFVTTAPPLALDAPATPFHAVTLTRTPSDQLRVVERLVPTDEPFGDGVEAILSRSATTFRLQYRDAEGAWLDHWDGKTAQGLPTAVRVQIALRAGGRERELGPLVIPIALGKEAV